MHAHMSLSVCMCMCVHVSQTFSLDLIILFVLSYSDVCLVTPLFCYLMREIKKSYDFEWVWK